MANQMTVEIENLTASGENTIVRDLSASGRIS